MGVKPILLRKTMQDLGKEEGVFLEILDKNKKGRENFPFLFLQIMLKRTIITTFLVNDS